MRTWLYRLEGNDVFVYEGTCRASCFKNAVTLTEEAMEAVQRTTIEALEIVEVALAA